MIPGCFPFFPQVKEGRNHDRNSIRDEVQGESEDGGGNVWVPFRSEEMNTPDFGTRTVYVVAPP